MFFVEGAMAILDSIDNIYLDDVDSNSGFHPSTEVAEKIAISITMYILTGDIAYIKKIFKSIIINWNDMI